MTQYGHQNNGYPVQGSQPSPAGAPGGPVRGFGMGSNMPGQASPEAYPGAAAGSGAGTGSAHVPRETFPGQQPAYTGQTADGTYAGYAAGSGAAQPQAGWQPHGGAAGAAFPTGSTPGAMPGPGAAAAAAMPGAVPPGYQAVRTVNGIQYVPILKKKKSKAAKIGIAVAIVCVLLAALIIYFMMTTDFKKARQGNAGQLEGKTAEEIQAELDRVVEEGMFNISISSMVEFEDGTAEGDLRIENVPNNHYLMRVFITRDDTGEQIYQTDFIEPNFHVQQDRLDVDLPAGTYPCTATFHAYDPDTEDEIGQAAAQMTIRVKN